MYTSIIPQINLSNKYLERRFGITEEELWGDLKKETLVAVKNLLETSMEVQVQDLIGSSHWEHNHNRLTYRNGHYSRGLLSSFGYLSKINVPRVRSGSIEFKVLKKYQRRTKDVDKLILEMFLCGVSTRKVEEVLEPLYGKKTVSPSLVSKVTKVLNKQVERFHSRKLADKYEYLILDGIFLNTKSPVYKRNRCILAAYGMWIENDKIKREMIDFQLASHGESEQAWNRFLYGLYYRGLEGKKLKLITTDGNKGLCNAIDLIYPQVLPQRCWVHKLRNVGNKVPRKLREVCISGARDIYNAESYSQSIRAYKIWVETWHPIAPEAVECLQRDIEELLNFYSCDKSLWKKIRTTNIIERVFREVRRRTRTMSCFQNRESLERIIFAIFYRQNKKWGNNELKKPEDSLCEITQLT